MLAWELVVVVQVLYRRDATDSTDSTYASITASQPVIAVMPIPRLITYVSRSEVKSYQANSEST